MKCDQFSKCGVRKAFRPKRHYKPTSSPFDLHNARNGLQPAKEGRLVTGRIIDTSTALRNY
jgi:hypothetical protein